MKQIRVYQCGLYQPFDCILKRKYSEDRTPVELPEVFTVLIVPGKMTDELLESLSSADNQAACVGEEYK